MVDEVKDTLQVTEADDGTAVVHLDGEDARLRKDAGSDKDEQGGSDEQGTDHSAQDAADNARQMSDADRDALRQRRREERQNKKQRRQQRVHEDHALIDALSQRNQELEQHIQSISNRVGTVEVSRIDSGIEDAKLRVEYANGQIAHAMESKDGAAMVQAQNMLFEARNTVEKLEAGKQALVDKHKTSNNGSIQPQNDVIKMMAAGWIRDNSWYKADLSDTDSQLAHTLDMGLVKRGLNPATPEYWDALDDEIDKYLPHLRKMAHNQGRNDENDDQEHHQDDQRGSTRRRSPVTGSDRQNGAGADGAPRGFRLSAERVAAIKEAGKWDDPVERNKMARSYQKYDKDHGARQ